MAARTLVHLVTALLLVGCACTQIGCINQITFALPFRVEPGVSYTVRACIDERCSDATLTVDGQDIRTAASAGELSLWGDEHRLELELGDGDFQGSHHVTLAMSDDTGASVASFDGNVELDRSQPNGAFCGPECWSTQIDL